MIYSRLDNISVYPRSLLKEQLKCAKFEWYLTNILSNLYIPEDHYEVVGQIRSKSDKDICLRLRFKSIQKCVGGNR